MLKEAESPGCSALKVARRYDVSPSLLYGWRKALNHSGNNKLVPESALHDVLRRERELERAVAEIATQSRAIKKSLSRSKRRVDIAITIIQEKGWRVKRVADVIGVARSNLIERLKAGPMSAKLANDSLERDQKLLRRIQQILQEHPNCGYRRVTTFLNRDQKREEYVNHKRVYRLMRDQKLLRGKKSLRCRNELVGGSSPLQPF